MKRYAARLTALLCGLILLIISLLYQDAGHITNAKDWIRIFSNASLVPGVLLTGLGLIVRIAEEGIFDGIKYAISSIRAHLHNSSKRYASYYDYMHREKKKSANPLLLPGLFYLAAAIILTILYYI